MAKYRVDTDQGSYIVETDEPPAQPPQGPRQPTPPSPSFGQQLMQEAVVNPARQVGAGWLGASATANRMGANIFDLADQLAGRISETTGLEKGGLFKDISGWMRSQQLGQEQQAAQLSGGRQDFPSQLYRGVTQGVAELPTYAVAGSALGPVAGMATVGAIRESDRGWQEALHAAAEGALLGKALHVMGPASRPIRLTGAAAMTYAQARLNGADNTTALANATTMGLLSGSRAGGATAKDILRNVPRPSLKSHLNPVEQAAVELLKERGVHVDVPTQTGNKFLRGAGTLAMNMPLGSSVVKKSIAATEEGLQRVSGELMQETHPQTVSPESSGTAVRGELLGRTEKLAEQSNVGYQAAWEHAGNPEFTYEVPVRMEPEIGQDGKPTGRMAEVLESVNMPVDVRDLKAQGRPLWEQWQWRPASERSQNAAYAALERLLKGPDFISAIEAEEGLKGFKTMARTENKSGQRDVAQGTAAGLIPELQERINEAVAHTGDKAIRGLEEGRKLWAEKEGIQDIYEDLPAEPVQAMGRLVWGRDTGIDFLRKVAKEAPEQMPQIGRALLEQLFGKATQGGGFGKTAGLLAKWRDVGPETKKILFKDPKLIADLDKFFLAAEMTQRNPNPSGSALVGQLSGLGFVMLNNPIAGSAYLLGGRALAKALYSPEGVALLTKGLQPQNPMVQAHAAARLLKLAGPQGVVEVPGGPSKVQEFLGELGTKAGKATGEFWREELGEEVLVPGLQKLQRPTRRGKGLPAEVSQMAPAEAEAAFQEQKLLTEPEPPAAGGGIALEPGMTPAQAKSAFQVEKARRRGIDPIAAVSLRFLMDQPLDVPAQGEAGQVKTLDVGRKIRETVRSSGGSLTPRSDAEIRRGRAELAMLDDLEYALASQPKAREWYTGSVAEMEAELVRNRPEFEDVGKRTLFKYLLGVTSNGVDPELNFDAAVRGWDLYRKHGRFMAYDPERTSEFSNSGEVGLTFRANSYKTAMKVLDRLVQEKGEAGVAEWLKSKHPIAELKQYDSDIAVGDGSPRLGSYVLGEKVGSFGANLNGIYTELTADKWWSRTWNRWMGTTIATNKEGRFKYDKEGEALMQDDPRNEGERNLMRQSAANVARKLDLTVAELQAVLWYAEQALYRAHGLEASSADYSLAAKKFFTKKSASDPASAPSQRSSGNRRASPR